jgi:predicted Fe-Mo cluster-binding NifX family protein
MKMPHRLALPVADGKFCQHFGRATEFVLCDVEQDSWVPGRTRSLVRRFKPGECESVPDWLKSMAVTMVLAGGIGAVAQHRLRELGIEVIAGLRGEDPIRVLSDWLDRRQTGGVNTCRQESHLLRHCRKESRRS